MADSLEDFKTTKRQLKIKYNEFDEILETIDNTHEFSKLIFASLILTYRQIVEPGYPRQGAQDEDRQIIDRDAEEVGDATSQLQGPILEEADQVQRNPIETQKQIQKVRGESHS